MGSKLSGWKEQRKPVRSSYRNDVAQRVIHLIARWVLTGTFVVLANPQLLGQDTSQSITDLQAKAESGSPHAKYELGKAYATGIEVPQDDHAAVRWYTQAAEQGDSDAENALGAMYLSGRGVEQNRAQALHFFHMAAKQKNPSAMFNVGAAYYNGDRDGRGIDDISSYAWFLLAKQYGSQPATDAVARAEKDLSIGQQNFALLQLADMYLKGDELPQDRDEAERLLRIVASRGDAQAKVRLAAVVVAKGHPDYQEVFKLCNESAHARNPGAEYCLGQLYQKGLGTERNPAEALKWFEAAASRGHLQATQAAALMLANGDTGKPDREQAFLYFFALVTKGDQSAVLEAAKLRAVMSKKEWKKALDQLKRSGFDEAKVEAALAKSPA